MVPWTLDDRKSIDVFGIHVMQSWYDLFFLNCILQYEKPRFTNIIEFGTGIGGTTLFLSLTSQGLPIHTFDKRPEPSHPMYKTFKEVFPITHYQGDIFEDDMKLLIRDLLKEGKTLLYCDNGNKPLEFQTFSKYLMRGDVIMAHDKGVEIKKKDVEIPAAQQGLTPYHQEDSDRFGTRIYCFKKTH